jgi:glycosyltransferase involved in cell wall biosynthesis
MKKKISKKTVILVEENLPVRGGHWDNYMRGLVKGFKSYNYSIECLGSASGQLTPEIQITPVFRISYWANPYSQLKASERLYRKFIHPWIWCSDLQEWSDSTNHTEDLIFAPNQSPMHLLAWGLWISKNNLGTFKKIIIGINYFGNGAQGQISILNRLHLNIAKLLLRRAITQKQVIFFSENHVARSWLQQKTGFRLHIMPHNVDASFATNIDQEITGYNSPLFVSIGFARYDKGSDLLLKAIESYLRNNNSNNSQFWLQWGKEVPRNKFCEGHPQVSFNDDLLDAAAIAKILQRADCALMPYRNCAYYGRLSRAAIDAVVGGCPVIYPHCSSINEIVDPYGIGVCFDDEDIKSLVNAIENVAVNFSSLKKKALLKSHMARSYYSPINHAKVILETIREFG